MREILDSLGQEIKVGSFVAMANGSYVRQEYGFVYKLGNANNAAVARNKHGGSYVAAEGLVVVNSILEQTFLDREIKEKYAAMYDEVKEIFTHSRPKSGRNPSYMLIIDYDTKTLFVRSFLNITEARKLFSEYRDSMNYRRFQVLHKAYNDAGIAFRSDTFMSGKAYFGYSFKQIKDLELDGYIDDDNGTPIDDKFMAAIR